MLRSPSRFRRAAKPAHQQAKPDPVGLRRSLRRRTVRTTVLAIAIVIAWSWLDQEGGVVPVADDWHRYHSRSFEVAGVIEGDTIDLRVADGDRRTTRIRLWGVDTPDLAKPEIAQPAQPRAEQARDYTRDRLAGQRVTLTLQAHRLRGDFGGLLAYVELPDGNDLNAELIERGLSEHDDRWGHDRANVYESIERGARSSGRGLWSD